MKCLLLLLTVSLIGCTTYPANYTYSPTVSVTGRDNDITLPSPFAKDSPDVIQSTRTRNMYMEQRQFVQPSVEVFDPSAPVCYYYGTAENPLNVEIRTSYPNYW